MSGNCRGSFSYIVTAQWDVVKGKKLNKYLNNPYTIPMTERVNIEHATKTLLDSGKWTPYQAVCNILDTGDDAYINGNTAFPFMDNGLPENIKARRPLYKEYLYFNRNVRQLVYNQADYRQNTRQYIKEIAGKQQPVVVFERKGVDDKGSKKAYYYMVRCAMSDEGKRYIAYRLPISCIQLRLYRTGIMSLAIRCCDEFDAGQSIYEKKNVDCCQVEIRNCLTDENCQWGKWEEAKDERDISWIEDAGRRLFAPFGIYDDSGCFPPNEVPVYSALSLNREEKTDSFENVKTNGWIEKKTEEDVEWIEIINMMRFVSDVHKSGEMDYPEHLRWTGELISKDCISEKNLKRNKKRYAKDAYRKYLIVDCFNDDRMYLHGSIVSMQLSEEVKKGFNTLYTDNVPTHFAGLKKWYGVIAADNDWNDSTCHSNKMLVDLVEKATDLRWCDYSTFYGLTNHCMVSLMGNGAPVFLTENMDWMYFQMFLIAILQRCSLQRFYREASGVLQIKKNRGDRKCRSALKEIYLLFLNRVWFNEVTEQEQGRDMFVRLQENMGIKQDVEILEDAFNELNEWEQKRVEATVNNLLLPLSIISGVGAAIGLLVDDWPGVWGMANYLISKLFKENVPEWFGTAINYIVIVGVAAVTLGVLVCFCIFLRNLLRKIIRRY